MAARKRQPIAKEHPAITALTYEHNAMREHATRANAIDGVGACFASDLEHDKRAITEHPSASFLWVVSYHGSHMMRVDDTTTRSIVQHTDVAKYLRCILETYHLTACSEGWLAVYVWDAKSAKLRAIDGSRGPDRLHDAACVVIAECIRDTAIARIEPRLKTARECDAAYPDDYNKREIAKLEAEIAEIKEWSR